MKPLNNLLPLLLCCGLTTGALITGSLTASAQQTIPWTKGLLTRQSTNYGREAIYKDSLAWALYTHTQPTPVEGDRWKAIQVDSAGRFSTRTRGGGYLYLTYQADKPINALLHVTGDAGVFVNSVPHAGDPYASGWLYIPVSLKKGNNEFYIRTAGPVTASLIIPQKPIQINAEDPTVPVIRKGSRENDSLKAAIVIINASPKPLQGYVLQTGNYTTDVPGIPPMSTRKVPFTFSAGAGQTEIALTLKKDAKIIDEKTVPLDVVDPGKQYSVTFTSDIDGSLQYYAVTPQQPTGEMQTAVTADNAAAPAGTVGVTKISGEAATLTPWLTGGGPALFLSVHGAGVEAIGQARAYHSKDWGTLVAATNRRPRGFNWEDWGRLDALEVLRLAEERFHPDPQRIYLTGHSMGGHGTWFLGVTYPDKWAAIGACSGYPTLKDYGSHDGVIPDSATSPIEAILLRASNQSDVIKLATNYKPLGVYILHGEKDRTVPVKYARQMREVLAAFHTDFSYHEVPGADHWYGNQSVDWSPLFDFLRWHIRKPESEVNDIDFMTASPGISDAYYWASIQQQERPLDYSRIRLHRSRDSVVGTTENVKLLRITCKTGWIALDGTHLTPTGDTIYLEKTGNAWRQTGKPAPWQKNPTRYGTFKDPFRNHMVFVYGTAGTPEENQWSLDKARYDAETWYYRGNGAVDIMADKDYRNDGRSVILYGNATTNKAYNALLEGCPIRIERNKVTEGTRTWTGDSLAAYFVWPQRSNEKASVAVIAGTGLKGMDAANANQYFAGASGFPDYMLFDIDMLRSGKVIDAGFFDQDWKLYPPF